MSGLASLTDVSLSPIEGDIVNAADAYGVDPRLALSTAQVESGLNPTDVGDGGTSFGLFQLHQGGELGSLSAAQAFNPVTNANTALAVIGQVAATNPGADPGAIAAAAQRPADPTSYAQAVDAVYNNPADFPQFPAASSATPSTSSAASSSSGGTDAVLTSKSLGSDIGQAIEQTVPGLGLANDLLGIVTGGASGVVGSAEKGAFTILLNIVFVVAALGLILLGLTRLFPGVTRTITTTVGTAAMA